jgi:hypothetical protein
MIRTCNGYCESFAYRGEVFAIRPHGGPVLDVKHGGDFLRWRSRHNGATRHFISAVKDSIAKHAKCHG